ncbi:MAG: hypothetical protein RG741_09295 [Bacteroidales bacterium]|nr:hypothetical protein [Bacteroidales bacterium]
MKLWRDSFRPVSLVIILLASTFHSSLQAQSNSEHNAQDHAFFEHQEEKLRLLADTVQIADTVHMRPELTPERPLPAATQAPDEPPGNEIPGGMAEPAVVNSIQDVSLRIENIDYFYSRDGLSYNGKQHLFFRITTPSPIAELRIYPQVEQQTIRELSLLPSADFRLLDSLVFVNNDHYRARIRFNNLMETAFPSLVFRYFGEEDNIINHEIPLFPYYVTTLFHGDELTELFQGEEKSLEISGNNLFNLYIDGQWQSQGPFEYRLEHSGRNLRLTVKANTTGHHTLTLQTQSIRPFVGVDGKLTFYPEPLKLEFNVKPSRLHFINTDKEVVYFDADRRRRQEVRLDHHPYFQTNRTYRIENRQEAGGQLIAEIHTKSFTSDNKVLADLVVFDMHRTSSGYLYIKEGNRTLFMTNFNIISRPEIKNIELLRPGEDWTVNRTVYPGETIEVKIEGEGLLDVDIRFDGCRQQQDTIRLSDRALFFVVEIPVDIPRRQIMLFMNREATPHELLVREHQVPASFDFISINFGEGEIPLTADRFNKPVFYGETIKDINIVFDTDAIDTEDKLFGKQYLKIEVRLVDDNNRLIDIQNINNIVVCPGESSPRHAFYRDNDCRAPVISLNQHLLRNTYLLEAFSQIIITVSHDESKYNAPVQSKRISIFVERTFSFDVMVSFPAGLLVKQFGQSGIGNLSGISTSVLAELSFYDQNRPGVKKPYKFGAGFIALNAFNFGESPDIQRDIGLVLIATIEPVRSSAKFSLPIYFGTGFLLKEQDFFAIFGPGIRLHF